MMESHSVAMVFFFFQAEDGIRDYKVTGVQTCALPIFGTILAGIQDKQIQVSGHTDATPLGDKRTSQFPTNWELSVARATNVVRFLQEDRKSVRVGKECRSRWSPYH